MNTAPISAPIKAAQPRAAAFGIALALIAGYVDTLGFVALFGLFMAHVTGNFVLIGSELAQPTHGVLIKFLAFPAFVLAVVAARLIVVKAQHTGRDARRQLLATQGVLLVAFMAAGWLALPIDDSRAPWVLAAGVLGACAMGIQNAASRLVWSNLAPSTVMTGNVTQLVIDLADLVAELVAVKQAGDGADLRNQVHKFLWPVLAFGVGAIGGAYAFRSFSFLALVLPIGLIGVLIFLTSHKG